MTIVAKRLDGWMKMPLGTEVDLGPGHIVLDGDAAFLAKVAQQPALFGLCLLWPRSPISATAELLYNLANISYTGVSGQRFVRNL